MSNELCDPGYHFDMPTDICLPCSPGTYNHGIKKVLDTCYTIPPGAEFMFFNATDVICSNGWVGIPIYEDGEYEEGCRDVDDGPPPSFHPVPYPSLAPSLVPSFAPSFDPSLAPSLAPSLDLCNMQWSEADLPLICQCIMAASASNTTTYYPTFAPSPAISSHQQIIAPSPIHSCSNICCYLWWVVLASLGIGRCILMLLRSRRRRAPINNQIENDQREVAMVAIPVGSRANIQPVSEEQAVLSRHDSLRVIPPDF